MIPVNASSFGRFTGAVRRYPGGTETAIILATLSREMLKCRAASRWLMPSAQASRTFRYKSTVKILPPSLSPERAKAADFYAARSRHIPPLPCPTFPPPFSIRPAAPELAARHNRPVGRRGDLRDDPGGNRPSRRGAGTRLAPSRARRRPRHARQPDAVISMGQSLIDALRDTPLGPRAHLIGRRAVTASDGATMAVTSPLDGRVLTSMARGTAIDMETAVAASRAAFADRRWAGQSPAARKKVLLRRAELIEAEALALAVLGVRDKGTEIAMAVKAEPGSAAGTILLLRRGAGQELRRDRADGGRYPRIGPPRTRGRRRGHRALEFPPDYRRVEACARPGHGQFGGGQTTQDGVSVAAADGRTGPRGGAAARRPERGYRRGRGGGQGASDVYGHRRSSLHRVGRHGMPVAGILGPLQPEARASRAWGQVAKHRLRRRARPA